MKKNYVLLLLVFAIALAGKTQTLYRTYYDYQKTHVQEEYYANSYGVKNGTYKKYSEYGGVLIQGQYKDDKQVGKWIVKNDKGITTLEMNYKDGNFDGPSVLYYDNGLKKEEGSYTDGYKTGNWYRYLIYRTEGDGFNSPQHIDVPKSAVVGSEYVKLLVHYKHELNGDGTQDVEYGDYGNVVYTFYPSGKKWREGRSVNDQWLGDCYTYYPNGKLEEFTERDTTNGKQLFDKQWAWPGGAKDSIPYYKAQVKQQQEQEQKNAAMAQKEAEKAQQRQDSLNAISRKQAEIEKRKQDSLNEISRKQAELARQQQNLLATDRKKIDSLYRAFKGLYVGTKQSKFLVDPRTHQPLVSTTYPNGEHLFVKSDTLIKYMYADFQKATDINSQVNKGNDIVTVLNKLISISGTDTKDMDKQMKKAETMDEIRKILGV